jgi:hypothetical protein
VARNRNRNRNRHQYQKPNTESPSSQESLNEDSSNENEDNVTNEDNQEESAEQTETIGDDLTGQTPSQQEEVVGSETSEESTEVVEEDKVVTPESGNDLEPPVIAEGITPPVKLRGATNCLIQADEAEFPNAIMSSEPAEETAVDSTTPVEGDTVAVVKLKQILKELKEALQGYGKEPEHFKHAATITVVLTKHVTNNARSEVFDALLAFYEENKDGVCKPEEFMKGSTTLSATDEHQVGFLHNLFLQLAHRRFFKVNHTQVVNVLKRPEIANYFSRKVAGIKANN